MKKLILPICLFIVLGFTLSVFAQPKPIIKIKAYSPYELEQMGLKTHTSSGLNVVGVGYLVYLGASNAAGDSITAYAWSVSAKPDTSNAKMDSTNTENTTFRSDVPGEYTIKLTITTASGTADTTVTIVAADYVGVGTIAGATPDYKKGQCGSCHAAKNSEWEGTGHAVMLQKGLNGENGSHYKSYCITCHTVGYNTDSLAVDGGFDDVAKTLGWTFPDSLYPGQWDSLVVNYPALAQKANIQCENCHGPGSLHKGDVSKIAVSLDEGVCGQCHADPPYHPRGVQWKLSKHAIGVGFAANESACASCHSGYGFIHATDPSTGLSQTTGFPQVSCAVCHDPHSAANEHQLRTVAPVTLGNGIVVSNAGSGQLCMQCHKSRRDAETYAVSYHRYYGPHHGPQADMLEGTNAITFGMYIPSSPHKTAVTDACVHCHMAATPTSGAAAGKMGAHTFEMSYGDSDNVAACQPCHAGIKSFDDVMASKDYDGNGKIEGATTEVQGLLDSVAVLLPPIGQDTVIVTSSFNKIQLKAAYDYLFVTEDGSHGIHNFQYAVNLLLVTKKALKYGVLTEGKIQAITDVPNDQGYQVRIVWSRFGGDGVSDNPVLNYAIFRKVDQMGKIANNVHVYNSIKSVPNNINILKSGTYVKTKDALWDFVATAPAVAQLQYSAIVPTLFNTVKGDTVYSVFKVAGLTANPAINVFSAPDSGFSVDNLAPSAPSGVTAAAVSNTIDLSWLKVKASDFDYYTIYRSKTANFKPTSANILATTINHSYSDSKVENDVTYYYKITATDFNKNESNYSEEVSSMITGVENEMGIPTQYALQQNFPNPFNPSTIIKYQLPKASFVRLSVFDITGQEVAVLVNGEEPAGYYSITWNASNFASGVYLYKIQIGEFNQVRKMLLVK